MLQKTIFFIAIIISFNSNSQNLNWVKQIYPADYDITITSSDSYLNSANIICGNFRDSVYFGFAPGSIGEYNPYSEPKVYIIKSDYNGNYIWHKMLEEGMITETRIDHNGDILLGLRHSSSSLDIDPGPGVVTVSNGSGGYEHILIKLSSSGDYLWHKIMPIGGFSFMNFEITNTNDIVVTGDFGSSFDFAGVNIELWGIENTFILEVDATGTENWVKRIGGTSASSFSTSFVNELDIDASGNIFITGKINGTIDFDPSFASGSLNTNYSKFFLAKYFCGGLYFCF